MSRQVEKTQELPESIKYIKKYQQNKINKETLCLIISIEYIFSSLRLGI